MTGLVVITRFSGELPLTVAATGLVTGWLARANVTDTEAVWVAPVGANFQFFKICITGPVRSGSPDGILTSSMLPAGSMASRARTGPGVPACLARVALS